MKSYPALLLAIVIIVGLSFVAPLLGGYYLPRVMYVGIMISMAVSLNLINGFTGQFSLGHAGFMAIGAYASACVTTYVNAQMGAVGPLPFLVALLTGGVLAAIAGLGVGIPSLRLRGDYLAIVTLG